MFYHLLGLTRYNFRQSGQIWYILNGTYLFIYTYHFSTVINRRYSPDWVWARMSFCSLIFVLDYWMMLKNMCNFISWLTLIQVSFPVCKLCIGKHVLQTIKLTNLFTQIKPAICNLALFQCIRNRTFNSSIISGFELELGWKGTLNRSAMWTQNITQEWENVMRRAYEYGIGLHLRHRTVFGVVIILLGCIDIDAWI